MTAKVHILYQFREGPWGGANQFLKALRHQWQLEGRYAEEVSDASAVLCNANPGALPWLSREIPTDRHQSKDPVLCADRWTNLRHSRARLVQ